MKTIASIASRPIKEDLAYGDDFVIISMTKLSITSFVVALSFYLSLYYIVAMQCFELLSEFHVLLEGQRTIMLTNFPFF